MEIIEPNSTKIEGIIDLGARITFDSRMTFDKLFSGPGFEHLLDLADRHAYVRGNSPLVNCLIMFNKITVDTLCPATGIPHDDAYGSPVRAVILARPHGEERTRENPTAICNKQTAIEVVQNHIEPLCVDIESYLQTVQSDTNATVLLESLTNFKLPHRLQMTDIKVLKMVMNNFLESHDAQTFASFYPFPDTPVGRAVESIYTRLIGIQNKLRDVSENIYLYSPEDFVIISTKMAHYYHAIHLLMHDSVGLLSATIPFKYNET